ncbi:immune inhibitor A, partial [candidate division WOR-3 bacterium]|nr:immune inhibitor A [candidate division WOR-3 bacterium]
LTFWCWYYHENNYDVTTVEVSVDGMEWIQLDNSCTGSHQSWTQKSYSLEPWVGKSVFIRFRAMTDDNTLREGFYVDDISPVPDFDSEVVISSNITDTFYTFVSKPDEKYWYNVRGYNAAYGWGSCYSSLKSIGVGVGVSEEKRENKAFFFSVFPNPFRDEVCINLGMDSFDNTRDRDVGCKMEDISINIYSVSGRSVKNFRISQFPISKVVWDGRDNMGRRLPAGVYYLKLKSKSRTLNKKLIMLD